jgi:hypothetical protein
MFPNSYGTTPVTAAVTVDLARIDYAGRATRGAEIHLDVADAGKPVR